MNGQQSNTEVVSSNQQESSPKPLHVIIVGAGIGGLFAAIALRKAGHHVEIFESSRFAVETGAAIHIPSNVNGLLRRYGLIPEDHGAVTCEWVSEGMPNGETKFRKDVRGLKYAFAYPWQLIHRIDLHNALKDIAKDVNGEGVPVTIHLQSRIISVDVEKTSIALHNGQVVSGDLILGADGVHSVVRKHVLGKDEPPYPSGTSAFRYLIPTADIKADPVTAHFVERPGELIMINGDARRMVMYPCRNNTELNFVALHPDAESSGTSDDWNAVGSKDTLLKVFDSFSNDIKTLLSKAHEDTVKVWKLLDLEPLSHWTAGNVALLGDAAHPFLPHQGQGGAQAMEDAAALGALFPLGTLASEIPTRLELYMKCRYERATMIQQYSRDSGFKVEGSKHGQKELMDPMRFTDINFDHDAHDHAIGILRRSLVKNAEYQRMPLSFGPSAGPRQNLQGKKREMMSNARYTTSYVTFKTKKTYLQTFLPTESLKISSRGGWTTATYSVTKLEDLDWLGGRGYSHFGLYIHDVVAQEKTDMAPDVNGTKQSNGDFLPVLFENMADPIITGREELGFSKVFATLQGEKCGDSYTLHAGWEGTTFCKLHLSDLIAESDSTPAEQAPILSYKAVPSSKALSGLDAEYVTTTELKIGGGLKEKKWKAGGAKISFCDLKGEQLRMAFPTLANIIEGLRNVEVCEVIASGIRASP